MVQLGLGTSENARNPRKPSPSVCQAEPCSGKAALSEFFDANMPCEELAQHVLPCQPVIDDRNGASRQLGEYGKEQPFQTEPAKSREGTCGSAISEAEVK